MRFGRMMETKTPYKQIALYHNAINKNRIVMNDYVMLSLTGITHCQMIAYVLLHGIEWIGDDNGV